MQRRGLLKLGVMSATAIAVVGTVSLLWQQPESQSRKLSATGLEVLAAVSAGLLEGSMPSDPQSRSAAMASHLDRLAATVSGLPPASQRELRQLLSILALAPGRLALSGLSTDWPNASRGEIHDALQTMRASRMTLRRQVYHALRDLTRAAWCADPTTWVAMGYAGPQAVA